MRSILCAGAMLLALCLAPGASAQGVYQRQAIAGVIDARTTINVRTNESINAKDTGRVFSGFVEQDVLDNQGNIVIPRGSNVELVVRKLSDNDLAVDLDSVTVNGQRYGIQTDENVINSRQKEGIGANKRTGEYLGGGAVIGAIIGAIAGGGKGAAIGAGAGAATGAGAQVLTRGRNIAVPAESLLTFRLAQPLRMGVVDNGYTRNGIHYHRYDQSDPNQRVYNTPRQKPGYYNYGQGTVSIDAANNITWQGPADAQVYVLVDNEPAKLFASGSSGTQNAPWILQGHRYIFVLNDASGNEIARDQVDLRSSRRR
jgi:hypothetical protein